MPSRSQTPVPYVGEEQQGLSASQELPPQSPGATPVGARKISYVEPLSQSQTFAPILESVDHAIKDTSFQRMHLPDNLTTDDFTRAVAVATVSALRHQQGVSPGRMRTSAVTEAEEGGHGGHDAPSWSRTVSASVLLGCTALYALIAGEFLDPSPRGSDFRRDVRQNYLWRSWTLYWKGRVLMKNSSE